MNIKWILVLHFLLVANILCAFDKKSAYITSFTQTTEIKFQDKSPITVADFEIVFKFNDEKAIRFYHTYSIYYSHFEKVENLEVFTRNPSAKGKTKTINTKDFKKSSAKGNSVFTTTKLN